MRKTFLSLIWVVVSAMPTLNAQQASPGQATATQQTSKPKAHSVRTMRRSRVPPTRATTANNDPAQKKGIANNPGHGKPSVNNPESYAEAMLRYRHQRHDHDWWKRHYVVIVLVGGGYYYQDSGYWYPAWGYDSNYERYDYDGPIYTYGNLLPDQVIVNVQKALKQLGYYAGEINGSLGGNTRSALSAYQQDYGLDPTGIVDEPTVLALGLI